MSSPPQFSTAEYASKSSNNCKACAQPLTSDYYRVNGALACPSCVEKVRGALPKDSHSAFVRGMLFGVGGAILGLILYAAFSIITGLIIGYVSLAVGYIVGKAMLMGSGGIGGRRYQIAAVILTYASVSLAAIPVAISQANKTAQTRNQTAVTSSPRNENNASDDSASDSTPATGSSAPKPHLGFFSAIGYLAIIGLASPFLELQNPVSGIIGLVILYVGLQIAWRLTAGKRLEILGPFKVSSPAPA